MLSVLNVSQAHSDVVLCGLGPIICLQQVLSKTMEVPDLSQLSVLSLVPQPADVGAPKKAAVGDGGRNNTKWQNWILRDTWSGVPGGMGGTMSEATRKTYGTKDKALAAAYSPMGEWEQREKKQDAVLKRSSPAYLAECEVNDNIFGFEPQGKHNLPPHMVREGLLAHYAPAKVNELMIEIPPPDATATHLRRWVRTLPEPSWWDGKKASPASSVAPVTSLQQVAVGADKWFGPVDSANKPHGVGTMFFSVTGESYRGQYDAGVLRQNSLGVKTLANNVASEGLYDSNGLWVPAQAVANRELAKEATRAAAIGNGFAYVDRMLVEKPGMGRIVAGQGQIVMRRASSDVHESIVSFFESSNPGELNKGADSRPYTGPGTGYTQIKPIATFDVDYNRSEIQREWERVQASYVADFASCPADDDDLFVRTQKAFVEADGTGITSQGVPLDTRTGEQYLVHGSNALAIESILNTNFDLSRSRQGWYGRAVYFADDPSKSDQYAKTDYGRRVYDLLKRLGVKDEEWRPHAVASETGHKEVFFMFVTRVALGCTAVLTKDRFDENKTPINAPLKAEKLFMDAGLPPVDKPYTDPKPGNEMRWVKELNPKFNSLAVSAYAVGNPFMRFREITIYNSVVAKVTHLVAYVRTNKVTSAEKEAKGQAWVAKGDPFGPRA